MAPSSLERSELLFGRHQAIAIYATIARLTKDEFTTGEVAAVSGVAPAACSKELTRLCLLGVIERASRRGDYRRLSATAFWAAMDSIALDWSDV